MYAFKYPEQTGRSGAIPWSLRQTAVYHQVRIKDGRSTFILISPYPETKGQRAANAWFFRFQSVSQVQAESFGLHDVLLDTYLPGHRSFSSFLEERTEQFVGSISSRRLLADYLSELQDVERWSQAHGQCNTARYEQP